MLLLLLPPPLRKALHSEQIVAGYVRSVGASLRIVTVELQYAQPGGVGRFVNGNDGRWVRTPCNFCWRPALGGAAMGGVVGGLQPVSTCSPASAASKYDDSFPIYWEGVEAR